VIALLGDGAMQIVGINALITLAHHWREWRDPRVVVMVLRNDDLNMVTWEQRATAGDPKFDASQNLPPFAYADYARLLGLYGRRVDRAEDIGAAWEQALNADRPTLLEFVTDPTVPPLPPHVDSKQIRSYLRALLHGDPQARAVVIATARGWWKARTARQHAETVSFARRRKCPNMATRQGRRSRLRCTSASTARSGAVLRARR
jgi:pyruvate dehydrogenase (quinone)